MAQTQARSTNDNSGNGTNGRPYQLVGMARDIETRMTRAGKPYLIMKFTCTIQGREREWTAMAFGKAFDKTNGQVSEGLVRLFAKIDGGRTLAIVGMGREPVAKAA